MIKRSFSILIIVVLLSTMVGAVDLFVDLVKVETDTPPQIVDGRTLVPLRAIFEHLDATVEWDGATRSVTAFRDDTTVYIQIDNRVATVNGQDVYLDVPARIINSRTMVPARFVSEALGCAVTWHAKSNTAAVADKLKYQPIYVTKTGKRYHFNETCNGGEYYEADLAEAMGRGLTPCDKCVLTNEYYRNLQKG